MAMARYAILGVAVVAALAAQLAAATKYPVGGNGNWDASNGAGYYNNWASKKVFKQGDTLGFNYPSGHDVTEVDESGYKACSGANAVKSYSDGDTTVKLASPGKHYFICSAPGHCAAGMKLEVTVVAAAATPATKPAGRHHKSVVAPTPAPAAAPEPASTEVSTPAPAPAPKSSEAASIVLGGKAVVVGLVAMALAM